MNREAHVEEIAVFEQCCKDVVEIDRRVESECSRGLAEARVVLEQTQAELAYSTGLLEKALAHEARCLARVRECESEVSAAAAGLPDTAAWYSAALARLAEARAEYEKAVAHRKRMEQRVEMAKQCVSIAVEMNDSLQMKFQYSRTEIQTASDRGLHRMSEAYAVLGVYRTEHIDGGGKAAKEAAKEGTQGANREKNSQVPDGTYTYTSLDDMKKGLHENYKQIKEHKPSNSPNVSKWMEDGGKIEVRVENGQQTWTYINKEGVRVPYPDGYPKFPPETKHPVIDDISIGSFTGDRTKDKAIYLKKLEEEYGLTEIPEGYALHHDSQDGNMQLVKEDYHKEFTHAGGYSKYKEAA